MKLNEIIRSVITSFITSDGLRDTKRQYYELKRKILRRPHEVIFFFQVDDPYSYLASQVIEDLEKNYQIAVKVHLVDRPKKNSVPMRKALSVYSIKDAKLIAAHHGLDFQDSYKLPSKKNQNIALRALSTSKNKITETRKITKKLWSGNINDIESSGITDNKINEIIKMGSKKREKLGHYQGAMFYYGGEWYWGVDRLPFLEERLKKLNLRKKELKSVTKFQKNTSFEETMDVSHLKVEYFISTRSPYTYLALPEILNLKKNYKINSVIKPLMPMVMRGLPVPKEKVMYIVNDAKRESSRIGVSFGKIFDPLGDAIKRGYSLYPYAKKMNRDGEYLLEFCRLAWSEGKDMRDTNNLKQAIENTSLSWSEAINFLDKDDWKVLIEKHREELIQSGLWGVPSFRLLDNNGNELFSSWGRDRLWLLTHEIKKHAKIRAGGS